MNVSQAYGPGKFGLSFELFPPKTPKGEETLFRNLAELMKTEPSYVTCTYGAGGSTQSKTMEIISRVRAEHRCPVASHLTCVNATVDHLREYLQRATEKGIENIVALRGDPPEGSTSFEATAGGLSYANELVALIRQEFSHFGIAVAGYPEKHRNAPSLAEDIVNLKRKVDSGADVVITQLFYNNADYFRFRELCEKAGIHVPIVPGLLPVTNLKQIQRITSLCGAKLPDKFVADLQAQGEDQQQQFEVGVAEAIRQSQELIDNGVPGIHFYVLNKSQATLQVLDAVSRPA